MALLDAVAGAAYVGRGLGTWRRRPGLMLLGAVPALLVALVVLGALVALLANLGDLVAWATPFADAWAEAVRGLLRVGLAVLVVIGFLLLASVTFTALTLLVGDPFYARIWRETEAALGGPVPSSGLSAWRSAADSLVLLAIGLATAVGVLLVGLLPVVGAVVGGVVGLAVSGWLLAGELLARPLEARGLDRVARRAVLRGQRARVLGFGVATQACFLVPLGAVAVMPAAVVGSTMLARDLLGEADVMRPAGTDLPPA
ncbi:EI24 domain-containing protein [Nocardioides sp. SOB44]|uniref:EI24 domain-containing protein n=1 Tax=Nocardioides cremeus TaxID=3058044 RepID=A0ABT8TNM2_9ACTN|nr:EI24 domain-containing protein [Nocardioides cremeus]MDO3395557.1 EI24 domain-containing protein [Nocardioides cremeus]